MRHRKDGRRLGRNISHRKAMMRNMVTALFQHGRITTTDTRAKELRRVAEKLITIGKRALRSSFPAEMEQEVYLQRRLHLFRQALLVLHDKAAARELFDTYATRYENRPGGYTRIVKLGRRPGDNAPVSIIELVEESLPEKTE